MYICALYPHAEGLSESAKALNERRKTKNIRSGGESVERFKALRTK